MQFASYQFGCGKPVPFVSFEATSEAYVDFCNCNGLTISSQPGCTIMNADGKAAAHVSYNGRVWAGGRKEWTPETPMLFDSRF